MNETNLLSYLKLINIKTINGYNKYLYSLIMSIFLTSLLELGIPADISSKYQILIDYCIIFLNVSVFSLLISKKYKTNKKEFIKNNDIDINTSVKECYEVLKKENIVTKDIPVDNIISRYCISPDNYYTEKGKRLIKKK